MSLSGIDGAGKSTQITAIRQKLTDAGICVRVLTFWDDIAFLPRGRELLSFFLFKGERGVGSPGKPVLRRDKNVRCWYMTVARFVLYFLDALSLRIALARIAAASDVDVVLFDRYLYDELANLNLNQGLSRAYIRLVLKFIPRPDIACLLDADPVRAHERKPEYPLDFVRSNRASYLALSTLAGGITVIPPLDPDEATRRVLQEMSRKLPGHPEVAFRDSLTSM